MSWIQTYSGRKFYPLDPRPGDVFLDDIAHALSLKCRFTGHCRKFYSVAEHSSRVALELERMGRIKKEKVCALVGLLHDAAEAYLPDIAAPIKGSCAAVTTCGDTHNVVPFRNLETRVLMTIYSGLGLPYQMHIEFEGLVRHMDLKMLATEARDIMCAPPEPWTDLPPPLEEKIRPISSKMAKREFISLYTRLCREIDL